MRSLFIALAFSLVATIATASTKDVIEKGGVKYTIHKIAKGETLYSLAQQYSITLDELFAANEDLSDNVKVGQKIKIPVKEVLIEEPKQEESVASPVVVDSEKAPEQKVDSLAALAAQSTQLLEQMLENTQPAAEPVALPFRKLQRGERAKVALMLPLGSVEKPNANYVDFYRGFLMGLDSVRLSGNSVDLHLYNTARDSVRMAEIIASGELATSNLVVGPVYDEEIKPVLAALEGKGIPVVSPLSTHTELKSDVLFQMAPSYETRLDKMKELLDGSRKVVIISTNNVEKRFDAAVRSMLKDTLNVVEMRFYTTPEQAISKNASEIAPLLQDSKPVIVVTSNNEYEVDRILNALHTLRQSLYIRYGEPFSIIGNGSWARFKHLDKEVFYKCGVQLMTSYNSDRFDRAIKTFERRFIRTYASMPSLFAYRGYDAAMIFVKSLFEERIEKNLEGEQFKPLCTLYEFKKNEETGVRANTEWTKQTYNSDSTITLE